MPPLKLCPPHPALRPAAAVQSCLFPATVVTLQARCKRLCESFFSEMLRIAQDFVYIGQVSDLAKKQLAEHLRLSSHGNSTSQKSSPPRLSVSKDLFRRVAAAHGVVAEIKDHTVAGSHAEIFVSVRLPRSASCGNRAGSAS